MGNITKLNLKPNTNSIVFKCGVCSNDQGVIACRTEILGQVSSQLIDTQDRLVREELIKLGWTPPKEI